MVLAKVSIFINAYLANAVTRDFLTERQVEQQNLLLFKALLTHKVFAQLQVAKYLMTPFQVRLNAAKSDVIANFMSDFLLTQS